MSDCFLGEIRLFSFGTIPRGWVPCDGRILQVNQNQALYSLLGNTFGGTPSQTFALPDLRSRVPLHVNPTQADFVYGKTGGEATHTLTQAEMPLHTHTVQASNSNATGGDPTGNTWGIPVPIPTTPPTATPNVFKSQNTSNPVVAMNAQTVAQTGASQAHDNMQPYLALNFCIATTGIYPSRN